MALFGTKKKNTTLTKKKEEQTTSSKTPTVAISRGLDNILVQPRITEKASFRTEGNVYTFEIAPKVTKKDVARAVEAIYNVSPVKVNTVKIPAKRKIKRGKWGVKRGGRKAYVFLKEGDTIELI